MDARLARRGFLVTLLVCLCACSSSVAWNVEEPSTDAERRADAMADRFCLLSCSACCANLVFLIALLTAH